MIIAPIIIHIFDDENMELSQQRFGTQTLSQQLSIKFTSCLVLLATTFTVVGATAVVIV